MRGALRLLAALLLPAAAAAAPDLSAPRDVGGLRVYPDYRKPGLYYLAPGDLEVSVDENGRPDLHFLQMRYTGTALYGNQGESGSFSTLTFGVRLHAPSEAELLFLRKSLHSLASLGRIELRPLPITAFEAVLAYTPIGEQTSELSVVDDGYFESEDEKGARSDDRSFWRERTFTIPMNAVTSQLLWDLLQRQEVALSISYAFFTRGVHSNELASVDVHSTEQEVEKEIVERLKGAGVPIATQRPTGIAARLLERVRAQRLGQRVEDAEDEGDDALPERTSVIHSGATAIRIDAARWPELLFKKVDVEATAVGGRTIGLAVKFLRSQPDLYARSVRFDLPVLLDRPYRYRVTAALPDGTLDTGPWIERESWSQILDVTSRPDEVTAAPQHALEEGQE